MQAPPQPPAAPATLPPWWLRALARVPLPVLYRVCGALATASRVLAGSRWRITLQNLRAVFPDEGEARIRALAAANYRHFADLAAELVAGLQMEREQLLDRVQVRDLELLRAQLRKGRPVLLMGSHQSNWDWGLYAVAASLDYPLDAA